MSPSHWVRLANTWADDSCLIDLRTLSIWGERKAPKTISPSTPTAPKIMTIALIVICVH